MARFTTALCCAVFLWVFWNASALGVYVGTYTSMADGELQCRYLTARGVVDEAKDDAITAHSRNLKWCPTTYAVAQDKDPRHKPSFINKLTGL